MKSFVAVPTESDFPLENLPYGIFSRSGQSNKRIGVAIGDQVLDVALVCHLFQGNHLAGKLDIFHQETLNDLMALGKDGEACMTC